METISDNKNGQKKFLNARSIIPSIALIMMIAGILFPAVFYSANLRHPTPTTLLVAICVCLFASVIFLWILDATSILQFRKEWISKSIYGAAISSVLGSSVAVYKDFFEADKYPLRGSWEIMIIDSQSNKTIFDNELLLGYCRNNAEYYGFSELDMKGTDSSLVSFIEIKKLSLNDNNVIADFVFRNGNRKCFIWDIIVATDLTQVEFAPDSPYKHYKIIMLRPHM